MKKNIDLALNFIRQQQKKDGSFWSLSSLNKNNFDNAKKYHSPFPSTLILSCLDLVEDSNEIKNKIAVFLLSQKSDYWSFNYWQRNSKESINMPYPDDLDDTFCAMSALYKYNPNLIDGSVLAKLVNLLTTMEIKTGGPYKTWLVTKDANPVWKDVDLAVNSNIGYFLSLQEIELKSINNLIKKAIKNGNITSPYYPSIYSITYFISRFFSDKTECGKLIRIILKKKKNDNWGNPLNTALAISTLLNLKFDQKSLKPSINYLIKTQKNDGSWKENGFCIDPAIEGKTFYAGSSVLTTAFCVEALNKYFLLISTNKETKEDVKAEEIHQEILKKAQERTDFLSKIPKENLKKSITLLPYVFYKSLGKNGKDISKELIIKCGLANLYGWIAYTIYDDFLDGEGEREKLSIANVCLRELSLIYNDLLPKTNFSNVFNETMDDIDKANYWEIKNCYDKNKLPIYKDYSQLAEKSLGHALGLVAILYSLGFNKSSPEIKKIWSFFENYLIARQLNDDAHDWEPDFEKGFINPVMVKILKKTSDKNQFKDVFWKEVLVDVSNIILDKVKIAKEKIKNIEIIENPEYLLSILENPEYSAKKSIKEQKETVEFINEYNV